ncbi:serine hydrolase domain-containing protein [Actinomycetospora sp. OC33-EN08]|uniref:Serine hydrolase domain-containing protein n=1 Tax=Actinomycetospora aurantiaca TaxID=3129233 RepID=A0ABU8MMZ7_9PSEU
MRPWILLLIGLLALAAAPTAHADEPARTAEDEVRDHAARFAVPATAAVVVRPDGTVATVLHGRTSDGLPTTPDTRFRIASMSKAFTAVAVLRLADEGRLRLDQPVSELLPGFSTAAPRGRPITVRDLLAHTSGLAAADVDEFALPPPGSAQEVVDGLAGVPPAREPGVAHEYLNAHYTVAARLVEVLSGRPFPDHLRNAVLLPLGMTSTVVTARCDDAVPGLAHGHVGALGVQVAVPEIPAFCLGDAGLVTTAADMTRWLRFQLGDGAPLLRPDTLRASHTASPGTAGRYGLGWSLRSGEDGPRVLHGGLVSTYTSAIEFSPGEAGAVVLTDTGDVTGSPGTLARRLTTLAGGGAVGPWPSEPKLVLDRVLAGLTVGAAVALAVAVARAPRRAAGLRGRRRPVSSPLLAVAVGIALLPTIWALFSGPSLTGWVMALWLLPTAAVLAAVLVLGGTAALAARSRARRALFRGAVR